jgi:hypothetical protein
MESRGLIEFRYADGEVVTGEYSDYSSRLLVKDERLDHDGISWLFYDREDRNGVTVHLFSPATPVVAEGSRARPRRRS